MNLKPTKLRLMHILFLPLIVLLLLLSGCTLPAGSAVARLLGQSNPPAGYVAIYTNEAFFISWTAINSNLTGQLQTGRLDGNTVTNSTHAFKGVFNSPSISINFTGSVLTDSLSGQTWTGTMKNGVLTLVYPADNGTLQTIVFKSGSINDYNQAINSLQAQGNSQATQQVQPTPTTNTEQPSNSQPTASNVQAPSTDQINKIMASTVEQDKTTYFIASSSPITVSDGAGGWITAVLGARHPSADGYGYLTFFWHNTDFIGYDATYEAMSSWIVSSGTGYITVSYAHYAQDDPLSSPSLPNVLITYKWNGKDFTSTSTPPLYGVPITYIPVN
jgi:hypothetical protein